MESTLPGPLKIVKARENVTAFVSDTTQSAKQRVKEFSDKPPDEYDQAITDYNAAFTAMNDRGISLLRQRERSVDLIELNEHLINSIANTPKSFATDLVAVSALKDDFIEAEEFAQKDLETARRSAAGAGVGAAAGAAVASMAPTAAMWVATTFGTASTGTAISTLSGAAASNAAVAWLGGGALAVGGQGVAGGSALLAMSGPIGWTIAGATLLTSILLFRKKMFENREAKQEALTAVKQNTERVKQLDVQIEALLVETTSMRKSLTTVYTECLSFLNADFLSLTEDQRARLAALVNNTKSCAALLGQTVQQSEET